MNSEELARNIRITALGMVHRAKSSHIGGAFSVADILAVLYTDILRFRSEEPSWSDRDRLFYSKGHACTTLYAALHLVGFYTKEVLNTFTCDGSILTSHVNHRVPGVELSTGSLGHALSIACGVALAAKRRSKNFRVITILSDGELDEGSNWEGLLFAPHHKLDNLTVIVDYNKIQSFGSVRDVLNLEPLADKLLSFGWSVQELDGHNHSDLKTVLSQIQSSNARPTVVIAHTTKGKGVSFMEDKLEWHYKSPNNEEFTLALRELNGITREEPNA